MTDLQSISEIGKIEYITDVGRLFAIVVRNSCNPDCTTFYTSNDVNFQLGHIVYRKEMTIPRHVHKETVRTVVGTNEVLVVQKGSCHARIFNDQREFVASTILETGDVVLLNGGGHEFEAIEDLQLLEVKQGPYTDQSEKERF
tara:strand:- start:6627 stop:7055 length:429 start_codon:yes stop_codon:yes gene_type:complete